MGLPGIEKTLGRRQRHHADREQVRHMEWEGGKNQVVEYRLIKTTS